MGCPGITQVRDPFNRCEEGTKKTVEMFDVDIPSFSIFIGYGYLKHAGVGVKGYRAFGFHFHLMPVDVELKGVVVFAYSASLEQNVGVHIELGPADKDSLDINQGENKEDFVQSKMNSNE